MSAHMFWGAHVFESAGAYAKKSHQHNANCTNSIRQYRNRSFGFSNVLEAGLFALVVVFFVCACCALHSTD